MTCITALLHRALIRVVGPDWAAFLKGLCTADIDTLQVDSAEGRFHSLHYGAFLRPQGKMICDCILQAAAPDEIWLDVPLAERDDLVAKLTMYRLRARVAIDKLDNPVFVAFGGDPASGFSPDPRGAIIAEAFGMAYTPKTPNTEVNQWLEFRFRHGISDPGFDYAREELYPIDANLDLLGGIDFHKGCFIGQELTSRMKRRGQIKNRVLPMRYDHAAPGPGAEILSAERRAGNVLRAAEGYALALMRIDRLDGDLTCDGARVALALPAWLRTAVATSVI